MIKYFFKQFLFHFLGYFFDSQLNCPCDALPTKTRGQTGKRLSVPGLLRIPLVGNFVLLSQKKEFTEKKTLWKNSISKRVLKKMKKKRNEMTSKWTFICSLAISGSGSEWVKTKTNSVHGNTAQKILDLANGRRYDQWDEAERLLVKLLKKVNNYLFGGG